MGQQMRLLRLATEGDQADVEGGYALTEDGRLDDAPEQLQAAVESGADLSDLIF